MQEKKSFQKNIKNIEKVMQLMKKYAVTSVEIDGLKLIKNLHDLPEPKRKAPETNGEEQIDPFLQELNKWDTPTQSKPNM